MEVESEKMPAPQSPAFLSAKKCQRDPGEHFSEPSKSGDHLFDRFFPRPTSGADFFSLRGHVPSRETTFLFIGRNIAKPYVCSFLLLSGKIFTFAHVSKMFCGENKETKKKALCHNEQTAALLLNFGFGHVLQYTPFILHFSALHFTHSYTTTEGVPKFCILKWTPEVRQKTSGVHYVYTSQFRRRERWSPDSGHDLADWKSPLPMWDGGKNGQKGGLPTRDTTSQTEKVRSRCGTGAKMVIKVVSRLGGLWKMLAGVQLAFFCPQKCSPGSRWHFLALKNAGDWCASIF